MRQGIRDDANATIGVIQTAEQDVYSEVFNRCWPAIVNDAYPRENFAFPHGIEKESGPFLPIYIFVMPIVPVLW